MAYSFVGYQVYGDLTFPGPAPVVTIDLGSLVGGSIAAGDVAFVMPFTPGGGAGPIVVDWGLDGFTEIGSWFKARDDNPSFGYHLGQIFEKELDGTETTVASTGSDSIIAAIVAVYRGLTARGASYTAQGVSDVTPGSAPPGPPAVIQTSTFTLPIQPDPAAGAYREIVLYVMFGSYGQANGGGGADVATWDAGITERITRYYPNGPTIGWGDEAYTGTAPLPARVSTVTSTVPLNFQYGYMERLWYPTEAPVAGGGDVWAWVG